MYTIYVDGHMLYNPLLASEGFAVTEASLSWEIDKTGYMYLTIPANNFALGEIARMKSMITVYDDELELFRGRVLHDTRNFDNSRTLYIEGELGFMADNVLSPYDNTVCAEWTPFITWLGRPFDGTLGDFFRYYVYVYNTQVEAAKQYAIGTVNATAASEQAELSNNEYPTIWDEINNKLIEPHGGHIRVQEQGGTHYIDWIQDYDGVSGQIIEFGRNLLDINDYLSAEDVVTVLIPLGAETETPDGRVNIKSVNDGKLYIVDDLGQALFGNIWRAHVWDDETNPATLLQLGRAYLTEAANPLKTMTVKAVDLGFTGVDGGHIRLGDRVRVVSPPHGIDAVYQCTQVSLDLLDPANSTYTIGTPPATATGEQAKSDKEIEDLQKRVEALEGSE